MSPKAIDKLITTTEGRLCALFYQRPDGTMLTENCPVGFRAAFWRASRAAAGLLTALVSMSAAHAKAEPNRQPSSLIQIQSPAQVIAIVVTDQAGAVVADASVTLRRQSDAKVFTTRTDAQGHIELADTPPGIYEITVYHNGFVTLPQRDVSIPLRKPLTLRLSLAVWMGEVMPTDPTFHLDTKSAPAPDLVEPSSPAPIENIKSPNSTDHPGKLHNFFSKLKRIF